MSHCHLLLIMAQELPLRGNAEICFLHPTTDDRCLGFLDGRSQEWKCEVRSGGDDCDNLASILNLATLHADGVHRTLAWRRRKVFSGEKTEYAEKHPISQTLLFCSPEAPALLESAPVRMAVFPLAGAME